MERKKSGNFAPIRSGITEFHNNSFCTSCNRIPCKKRNCPNFENISKRRRIDSSQHVNFLQVENNSQTSHTPIQSNNNNLSTQIDTVEIFSTSQLIDNSQLSVNSNFEGTQTNSISNDEASLIKFLDSTIQNDNLFIQTTEADHNANIEANNTQSHPIANSSQILTPTQNIRKKKPKFHFVIPNTPSEAKTMSTVSITNFNHPSNHVEQVGKGIDLPSDWSIMSLHQKVDNLELQIGTASTHTVLDSCVKISNSNKQLMNMNLSNTSNECNIELNAESRKYAIQSYSNLAKVNAALNSGNISQQIGIIASGNKSNWVYPAFDGLKKKYGKSETDTKILHDRTIPTEHRIITTILVRFIAYISQFALRIIKILVGDAIVCWRTMHKGINLIVSPYKLLAKHGAATVQNISALFDKWAQLLTLVNSSQKQLIIRVMVDGRPMKGKRNQSTVQFALGPLINGISAQCPYLITPLAIFGGKENHLTFKRHLQSYFHQFGKLKHYTIKQNQKEIILKLRFIINTDLAALYQMHSQNANITNSDFCFCPYCKIKFCNRATLDSNAIHKRSTFKIFDIDWDINLICICTMHMIFRLVENLFMNLIETEEAAKLITARLHKLSLGNNIYEKYGRYHIQKLNSTSAYIIAAHWREIFCPKNQESLFNEQSAQYMICSILFEIVLPVCKLDNNQILQLFYNPNTKETLQKLLLSLGKLWKSQFRNFPIYLHILIFHIIDLIVKWGSLKCFELQALEKSNNMHQIWQMNSTNNGKGMPVNMQILRKAISLLDVVIFCVRQKNSVNTLISKICNIVLSNITILTSNTLFDAYNYFDSNEEEKKSVVEDFYQTMSKNSEDETNNLQNEVAVILQNMIKVTTLIKPVVESSTIQEGKELVDTMEENLNWMNLDTTEENVIEENEIIINE